MTRPARWQHPIRALYAGVRNNSGQSSMAGFGNLPPSLAAHVAVSFCSVPPVGNDRRPVQWESTEQKVLAPAGGFLLGPRGAGRRRRRRAVGRGGPAWLAPRNGSCSRKKAPGVEMRNRGAQPPRPVPPRNNSRAAFLLARPSRKERIARHESGHAVAARLLRLPECGEV